MKEILGKPYSCPILTCRYSFYPNMQSSHSIAFTTCERVLGWLILIGGWLWWHSVGWRRRIGVVCWSEDGDTRLYRHRCWWHLLCITSYSRPLVWFSACMSVRWDLPVDRLMNGEPQSFERHVAQVGNQSWEEVLALRKSEEWGQPVVHWLAFLGCRLLSPREAIPSNWSDTRLIVVLY